MHHHFDGTLTERDHKRHIAHDIHVPDGTTRLEIRFAFAPHIVDGMKNMLCLSLFDPRGFRGAGHRHGSEHIVTLTADTATPGYLPGPLPGGLWSVVIDTHMVMPGEPCVYTLDVSATSEPVAATAPQQTTAQLRPESGGPGWYRGDLHAHTIHSDAHWDMPDLLAAARARGLDFVTLTDHNTVSGLPAFARAAATDLLTMGGLELTTFWGHALALGTRQWVDWRVQAGQRSMRDIARDVEASGALFVIAHPFSPGDPICTGCDWRYAEMMPGNAHAVEIWNGLWNGDTDNEQGLALWYNWLNEGYRLAATAGTDAHGPAPADARPGFNVVHAAARTEQDILKAVRDGRLYLSSGPTVSFTAETSGDVIMQIGDQLPDSSATLHASWNNGPAHGQARLIVDGEVHAAASAGAHGDAHWELPRVGRWCVLELRDSDGLMLAVTNPIFLNGWRERTRL
jgi:hypothetical protein